jgi:hypothetical protein
VAHGGKSMNEYPWWNIEKYRHACQEAHLGVTGLERKTACRFPSHRYQEIGPVFQHIEQLTMDDSDISKW